MKKLFSVLAILAVVASGILVSCGPDGGTGTLQFYANGEDFVRQGFVSKDGWAITFDHVYITLADITAYQSDPPYDPHAGSDVQSKVEVSLDGGASYQAATLQASTWTFDQASWLGNRVEFAIVRARDVWDNLAWEVVIIPLSEIYLPVVFKLE